MLTFSDENAALDLYKTAFNAQLLWHLGDGGQVAVAGLSIDGAKFFLAHESPPHGTRAPADAGYTTVRIEYSLTTRSRCTGERTRLELSSEVQLKNMSTQCLGQIRSNECFRVLCGTRLAICC